MKAIDWSKLALAFGIFLIIIIVGLLAFALFAWLIMHEWLFWGIMGLVLSGIIIVLIYKSLN